MKVKGKNLTISRINLKYRNSGPRDRLREILASGMPPRPPISSITKRPQSHEISLGPGALLDWPVKVPEL